MDPQTATNELGAELMRDFGKPCDAKKIKACIDAGANLNAVDENDNTPLHQCVAQSRDVATLQALIAAGAPMETQNKSGVTPLAFAAGYGRADLALELIRSKADVNAICADGGSPLTMALNLGHAPVARALIEAGAEVNTQLKAGSTPLMLATIHNLADIAEMLLQRGADPDKPRADGATPYTIAVSAKSPIAEMIRQAKKQRAIDAAARAITEKKEMVENLGAAVYAGTETPLTVRTLRLKPKQP